MFKLNRYTSINRIRFSPPQILSIGFLITILIGSFLLMLPISLKDGKHVSFLDAMFEATSAVCVTGLVVTDTGTTFTMFGQTVILLLIQIGGLGFMTFGVLAAILLGRKISLSERLIVQNSDKMALSQMSLTKWSRATKGSEGFWRNITTRMKIKKNLRGIASWLA